MIRNALRFWPRQFVDVLLVRGAALLIVSIFLALPVFLRDFSTMAEPPDWRTLLGQTLTWTGTILAVIATLHVTGEDFRRGYFRTLFAKPVSPLWYYGQAYLSCAGVYLLTLLAIVGLFAMLQTPVWPMRGLLTALLEFLLIGGMTFGLSRVVRLDWLGAGGLYLLGIVLRNVYPPGDSLRGAVLNVVLPPSHLFTTNYLDSLFSSGPLLWIGAYAMLWLTIGFASVRLIPFGTARQ